jgi:RHS repeat-associated protein
LRLTAITNPAGAVWRYTYDAAGRLVEETDFDGRVQRYTHDAAGQLIAHTNAGGETTHYAYDVLGRVIERRTGHAITRLQYDPEGRISTVTSPDAEVSFERDGLGRIIAETINGRTVRTSYDGDLVGARTTPSGRSSRWTFDADGRPASLATGEHVVRFGHDAAGREISRTVDDVVALRQTFDAAGRLAVQHIADTAERDFSYDAADRVTAIADSVAGDRSFEADVRGRIHTVTADGENPERYEYDEAGNLTGAGGGRWVFDGTMLVRSDDATFEYDEKGRLVGRSDAVGTWRFGWDAEDRMVQAVTPGGDRWRYRYDGFGRRIAKQRVADDDTVLEEVRFAWSGDLMVEQSGTSTISWDYWPDGSAPVAQTDDEALHTIITDLIGTPTHLVESTGGLRWWSRTDLWGRSKDAAATPLRFPGQYHDAETGLHYNRFRYYDPATARYLSPDPLGLSGGPNPTSYVPDPLTVADPLGLTSCKVTSPSVNPLAGTGPSPAVASGSEPSQLPTAATVPSPTALTGVPQVAPTSTANTSPTSDSQAQQWLADVAASVPPTLPTSTLEDIQQQLQQLPAQDGSTDGIVLGHHSGRSKRDSTKRDTDRSSGRHDHGHHTRHRRSASPDARPRPLTTAVPTRGPNNERLWNGRRDTIPFLAGVREGLIAALPQRHYREAVIGRDGHQRRDRNNNRVFREWTEYTAVCGHTVDNSSSIDIDHKDGILSHVHLNADAINWRQDLGNGFSRDVEAVTLQEAAKAASDLPNLQALCGPCNRKKAKDSSSKHMDQSGPSFYGPMYYEPPAPPPSKFDTKYRKDYDDDDQGGGAGFISNPGGFSGGRSSDYYAARGTTYLNMANGNGTHSATIDGREIALPPVSNLSQNADGTWLADGKPLIQHPLTTRPGFALVSDEDWAAMGQGIGIPADPAKVPTPMVVVHGGDSVVAAPVREPDGSTSYLALSPSQLDMMANYPPGSALALASCRIGSPVVGTAGENFSQELAVQRNGDVLAPTVDLKLNSRSLWTADNTPWQLFTAGDLGTGGYDTFNDVKPIAGIGAQQDPTGQPNSDPGTAPATDTDTDTDVTTQVAPDSYPPSAPFTSVAPTTVAKTTAQTPTAGDPIDVTTGRMILTHTDAVLPGLTLERTYRSDYQWGRSFGRSWASTLDQRVIVDGDQVRYLAADGSVLAYPLPAEGDTALPDVGRALPLRRLLGGGWLLTDPTSGRSLVFAPATDTESLLSDVTDGGVRWSIDRDKFGTPARLRSSAGSAIGFGSFDGQVTELLLPDPDGALVSAYKFGYNGNLELIEVVNSSGDPERFSYLDGRIVQWEDRNGEWYTYDYDEAGRCVSTDGRGGYLRYRFDYQPGLTVVTDSVGAVRRYELNDLLQVVAETDALGATTRREWDEAYRLRSEVDPLGRTTAYGYDAEGRRTTITRADGSSSTVAYDERGRAVSWTDFDGSTRNREFDVDGRMLAETDADGMVVGFDLPAENGTETATQAGPTVVVRNAARSVISMTTGDAETLYEYDSLGRVAGMENEQGVTYFGWTPEGELAWRDNPDGSSEEFVYDGEGNLVETLDATGRRTLMEYGAFDMVTAQIDWDGNRTEYAYDTELRLTTITNPAGETWRYTYDPNGRMIEETDFGGRTQRYAYDAAGQVVEHTNAAGEVTYYTYDLLGQVVERRTGTAVTQLSYDLAGRIVSAVDADSTIRLERDALGRVVSETVNGNTVVTSYSERFGAVDARIRPSGAVTQWSYDESGRPSVLAAGDRRVRFGYADGREVSRTSDAGLTLQQSFDDLGRLAAQRIEGVTDRRYTYDQAHRLIAVHDEVQGDRTIDPDGAGRSDAIRYTFDALGRPVTRSDASGDWQFGWDHQDRLVAVSTPGGDRWLYRYDAFGRRTVKQRVNAKGTMLEETAFTWSGDLLIEQQHKSREGRATTTSWEYHPALAHPIVQVTDGTVHAVVTDGDGVPMDLVGIDGGPAAGPAAIPVRSGGRYLDAETGLQYDGGRYFDPATDRFLLEHREAPALLR